MVYRHKALYCPYFVFKIDATRISSISVCTVTAFEGRFAEDDLLGRESKAAATPMEWAEEWNWFGMPSSVTAECSFRIYGSLGPWPWI